MLLTQLVVAFYIVYIYLAYFFNNLDNVPCGHVAIAGMWPPHQNRENARRVIQLQPQWLPHNRKTPFFERADLF